MNIGEKIKQLRTEKNLTQPQLAEAIGIEQSYLSKLENDKSIPSADIFQAVLRGLSVDVGTFLQGIDESIIRGPLKQIPEVALYLNNQFGERMHNIKKWLYVSAAACVIGLTLIVAGYKGLIFSAKQYNYISKGVFLDNESAELFDFGVFNNGLQNQEYAKLISREEAYQLKEEFTRDRIRPIYQLSTIYRGQEYVVNVEGGARKYSLVSEVYNEPPQNRWLMLIGTLFTFSGLFGFIVEFRLRKI